jgi:acid phosphatase family membrane protein YuiD
MYFPHALGFGIGWSLAFLILFILIKDKVKKTSTSRGGGIDTTVLTQLVQKLGEVKTKFEDKRFEELKNRESAYSRNPQAFKYDFNGFFKEHDDRVKALDNELNATLTKCNEFLQEAKAKKQAEDRKVEKESGKNQLDILGLIGVIVIILVNIIFFTKLF